MPVAYPSEATTPEPFGGAANDAAAHPATRAGLSLTR
jgi:hypothetical protein